MDLGNVSDAIVHSIYKDEFPMVRALMFMVTHRIRSTMIFYINY